MQHGFKIPKYTNCSNTPLIGPISMDSDSRHSISILYIPWGKIWSTCSKPFTEETTVHGLVHCTWHMSEHGVACGIPGWSQSSGKDEPPPVVSWPGVASGSPLLLAHTSQWLTPGPSSSNLESWSFWFSQHSAPNRPSYNIALSTHRCKPLYTAVNTGTCKLLQT